MKPTALVNGRVLGDAGFLDGRAVLLRGGAESNPLMSAIVDNTAHASFVKCLCLAIIVALALRTRFPGRVAWTLGAVNLWYAVVVGWNMTVLARA